MKCLRNKSTTKNLNLNGMTSQNKAPVFCLLSQEVCKKFVFAHPHLKGKKINREISHNVYSYMISNKGALTRNASANNYCNTR